MADPGFSLGGGTNRRGGGGVLPKYDFAKISQKLHKIERIWTGGGEGARPNFYYVDPPLKGSWLTCTKFGCVEGNNSWLRISELSCVLGHSTRACGIPFEKKLDICLPILLVYLHLLHSFVSRVE